MTNMPESDVSILKTDIKGRVQTPVARRESLLDEYERSGLSGPKFASLVGIKYQTFAGWLSRRRKTATAKTPGHPTDPVRWLEAVVEQSQASGAPKSSPLIVQLAGGVRIELADVKQVPLAVALLRSLEKPC